MGDEAGGIQKKAFLPQVTIIWGVTGSGLWMSFWLFYEVKEKIVRTTR